MTLDELRALLSPDRLDEIAAHNCGASEVALTLASELTDALNERDEMTAKASMLTEAVAVRDRAVVELSLSVTRLTEMVESLERTVLHTAIAYGAEVERLKAAMPTASEIHVLRNVISDWELTEGKHSASADLAWEAINRLVPRVSK